MMQSDNLPEILLVPWVMAVEPEPPASETPEPVPAAEPVTDRGVPLPFALAAAFVVAIAVVALPAVYFGWFDGAVLFGMLGGAMIATAIAIVAYPAPFPSPTPETFWTWGGEPVGQCTPQPQHADGPAMTAHNRNDTPVAASRPEWVQMATATRSARS